MISFPKLKSALQEILDDLSAAAFSAFSRMEEGEPFAPFIKATRPVAQPVTDEMAA